MGFERFFGAPKAEKSPEKKKETKADALGMAAVVTTGAAIGALAAYEGHMEQVKGEEARVTGPIPAVSTMPAGYKNPTEGMTSASAPKPISIPKLEVNRSSTDLANDQESIPAPAAPTSELDFPDTRSSVTLDTPHNKLDFPDNRVSIDTPKK